MKGFPRARMVLALALYLAALVAFIWPVGMARRAWMVLARGDPAYRRRANAAHNTRNGARLARMVSLVMGTEFLVRVPAARPSRKLIYVINHRSALDVAILLRVASLMGDVDVRWVIKEGILRVPLVASLMRGTGYAVVTRRKDRPRLSESDRRAHNVLVMDRFVEAAREDNVSVGIFPEGTRFDGAPENAARRHVGELRGKAGFRSLCHGLPNHDVAVVTVLWPTPPGGTTLLDADRFCDRTVGVDVRVYPHVAPDEADAFLESVWDQMDRRLASLASGETDVFRYLAS